MNILCWNCQGIGNPWTVQGLKGMLHHNVPTMIFLSETRCNSVEMEKVRRQLGLKHCFTVDCRMIHTRNDKGVRRAGGLCLLWGEDVTADLQSFSHSHIDMVVGLTINSLRWRFTGFYGEPKVADRSKSWSLLRSLSLQGNLPWIVGGDFNEITSYADKEGGIVRNKRQIEGLNNALGFCDLKEVCFTGPRFTWQGMRAGHSIKIRLDRFVASESWSSIFKAAQILHLPPNKSDHVPILLEARREKLIHRGRRREFRYEDQWGLDDECRDIIQQSWAQHYGTDPFDSICNKTASTRGALTTWSERKFKGIQRQIKDTRGKLAQFFEEGSNVSMEEKVKLELELNSLIERDMVYWKQRAKALWLKDGDANTTFFHKVASEKRRHKQLAGLFDEHGAWCQTDEQLEGVVVNYFSKLFTPSGVKLLDESLSCVEAVISSDTNAMLARDITKEEVHAALFQMHPTKAPGPDGFSPGFYQKYWDIVGDDVWKAVQSFLLSPQQMQRINQTNICLIPKVPSPTTMMELRPISLCNVLYKIGSKVLANRLKPIMDGLISPSQSAFVPGRLISDNTILAYETLHHMKLKRSGKKGVCALKLDMSKAYDRVEWCFLERMMTCLGFCDVWIQMVMRCISLVSYSVLVNGQRKGKVIPGRGLRQGCPLSPYLFLFCGEIFSKLLTSAEDKGEIKGIAICRSAPSISHLLFADDALVFCRAETSDFTALQGVLKNFEIISGQQINFGKSSVAFSRNVALEEQVRLSDMLGVQRVENHDTYLGLPLSIGRSKVHAFSYLTQRMRKKAEGWREKTLSMAGRETMIKSVLQAIPTYVMSCFVLPNSVCEDMHGIMARFWWGDDPGKRGLHWMAWEKLCASKREGGLGFRNMKEFNLALLARQGWRLLRFPNSLVARVMKAKYFPTVDFFDAEVKPNASLMWRSIITGRVVLEKGSRFQVGSGSSIRVWKDRWIPLPHRFMPFSRPHPGMEELRVSELIDQSRETWNIPLLQHLFTSSEVDVIARIPVSQRSVDDRRIWHYNKNGEYSVRSGYFVERMVKAATITAGSSGSSSGGGMAAVWNSLWALKVPAKIRVFIWRLLNDAIPTRHRLRQHHVPIPSVECLLCGDEVESREHLFRDCGAVAAFWSQVSIGRKLGTRQQVSIKEWIIIQLENLEAKDAAAFVTSLWVVWRARNDVLWNQRDFDASFAAIWVEKTWKDYWQTHVKLGGVKNTRQKTKWRCPPTGRLKVNIDGAFDNQIGEGGVGVIVRNELGAGVAAVARPVKYASSAFQMEIEACKAGLKLGIQQGWQHIDMESDSILLVSALKGGKCTHADVNHILGDCLELISSFLSFSISHIFRESNGVANRLAKFARLGVLNNTWTDVMPDIIQDVMLEDLDSMSDHARSCGPMSTPVQRCSTSIPINELGEGVVPSS